MPTTQDISIRIEVAAETMTRLLTAGQVCAADLRCLDAESKQCLRRLLLKSCLTSRNRADNPHRQVCVRCLETKNTKPMAETG